ncbi:MAG: sulfatase-like hydrolase/transferase [Myxococcota bacterium]
MLPPRIRTFAWALLLAACHREKEQSPAPTRKADPAPATATPASGAAESQEKVELLSRLESCEVSHEGVIVDMGASGVNARRRFALGPFPDTLPSDREGASFERVTSANLWLDVWLDQPIAKPQLSLRVHGGAARVLHLGVDDVRLGSLRLPGDETRTLASAVGSSGLSRGRHRITLRLAGAPRSNKGALAEVDWIRLSEPDAEPARYAAPTRRDVVADVALDRVPKRSLVLRAPSSVRCWLRPSADARLKVAVGLLGSGRGVAELRLLRDSEQPVVLQTRKVAGGDGASWTPVALDLGAYSQSVVGLEFAALEATRGGRLAFGDPMVVRRAAEPPPPMPRARVAVVVVLAAGNRRRLPPWGPTGELRTLGELSRQSTVWSAHRAPSSVAAAVVGSLLSGLPPAAHGCSDPSSRLAAEVRLISEIVKESSGRAAMFTGAPTTFAPFGFDQGWDMFEAVSPVKDLPAAEPIQRASRWLEQALDDTQIQPVLAVIHARGGHPPWDASREEAQHLKPVDYGGAIDPRRGGIIIGALRNRQRRARHLSEDDWTRVHELAHASLAKQDAVLGQLVALLKRRGVWDETLLVVTGDVAPGEPPDFPFDPKGALTEDRLLVPLLIKFPGGVLAGKEVQAPSSMEDLNVTLLNALGLRVPEGVAGVDLYLRAQGREPLDTPVQVANVGDRYATRLGAWLLRGQANNVPVLCALDVDPACVSDVFDRELVAARALWQGSFSVLNQARRAAPPEASRRALELDADTAAGLVVWGDQ